MADWDLILLSHSDLDVCDHDRVRQVLGESRPEVVINTAAFHRVDDCEEQVEKAFAVNAIAVRNLAQVCADSDYTLVHISTDYVFDGEKGEPYTEMDLPNPLNVYGVSKLAGEYFVRNICRKHFVVRSSGLYGVAGSSGKGGNFVATMIRMARERKQIRVVDDQVLSPTYTEDLAYKISELLQTEAYGIYHIASTGECSWFQFAERIFRLVGLDPDFVPVSTEEYTEKADRPRYSALGQAGLEAASLEALAPWDAALRAYLTQKAHI